MTLFVLGAVRMDTRPFNADDFDRTASADLATKSIMGGFEPSEFMGEGEDQITLSGQLLPSRIGGLTEFETLDEMRRQGARFPLMRGDGKRFGVYAIVRISEKHKHLDRDGVGFTVDYSVTLKKVQGGYDGAALIASLVSLFSAVA